MTRPQREDYVRVTCTWRDFTVEPAIEYRDGDSFAEMSETLRNFVQGQCDVRMMSITDGCEAVIDAIEKALGLGRYETTPIVTVGSPWSPYP